MTLSVSTGLRDKMLDTGSFRSRMNLGFMKIYAGTVPADADQSIGSATLLRTLTKDGDDVTGLSFAASASGGTITKATEVWTDTGAAGGVATFWRFVKAGDTGTLSTTEERLQGTCGLTAPADLVMTSTTIASNAPTAVDYFTIALPA